MDNPILPTAQSQAQPTAQDYREIPLTRGYVALVDAEDYEWLTRDYKWCVCFSRRKNTEPSPRAYSRIRGSGRACSSKLILMHRLITNAPRGLDVDHIDHNGLNNRRNNLRICSRSENNWNQSLDEQTKSKGVYWDWQRGKWRAYISQFNKRYELGRFEDKTDALRAYDLAAIRLFGEFSFTNFPKSEYLNVRS